MKYSEKPFQFKILLTILLFVLCLTSFGKPIITIVNPSYGAIGSSVVITGSGFAANNDLNTVYFGTIKAKVTASTSNSITVIVPAGASYQCISVTSDGLTTYSILPFTVIFPGADTEISTGSFGPKEIMAQASTALSIKAADFDNDGRPDLALISRSADYMTYLSVCRNTSIAGYSQFDNKIVIDSGIYANGQNVSNLSIIDIDGDGKLDISVSIGGVGNNSVAIYRNTSVGETISFIRASTIPVKPAFRQTGEISVADLNLDGKPDLIAGFGETDFFTILQNSSTPGNISFQPNIIYTITGETDFFYATPGDFNGDGKPDLLLSGQNYSPGLGNNVRMIVLMNTSENGIISFQNDGTYTAINTQLVYKVSTGDFDGDGKLDWAVKSNSQNIFHVYRNTSTAAVISFAASADFPVISLTYDLSASDMDGDGKADIVVKKIDTVAVFKNNSTPGNISFAVPTNFPSVAVNYVNIGDINTDGKPDILCANLNENTFSVLKNKTDVFEVVSLCPGSDTTFTSQKAGPAFQWQVSTDSGSTFSNLSNNNYYQGTATANLSLHEIPSSFYGYRYRCIVNNDSTKPFELTFKNVWIGAQNNLWANPANWSCGSVPDYNTDVIIESGTVIIDGDFSCRSLVAKPAVSVTVTPGHTLTIMH